MTFHVFQKRKELIHHLYHWSIMERWGFPRAPWISSEDSGLPLNPESEVKCSTGGFVSQRCWSVEGSSGMSTSQLYPEMRSSCWIRRAGRWSFKLKTHCFLHQKKQSSSQSTCRRESVLSCASTIKGLSKILLIKINMFSLPVCKQRPLNIYR